jgi:hypothetical protein
MSGLLLSDRRDEDTRVTAVDFALPPLLFLPLELFAVAFFAIACLLNSKTQFGHLTPATHRRFRKTVTFRKRLAVLTL